MSAIRPTTSNRARTLRRIALRGVGIVSMILIATMLGALGNLAYGDGDMPAEEPVASPSEGTESMEPDAPVDTDVPAEGGLVPIDGEAAPVETELTGEARLLEALNGETEEESSEESDDEMTPDLSITATLGGMTYRASPAALEEDDGYVLYLPSHANAAAVAMMFMDASGHDVRVWASEWKQSCGEVLASGRVPLAAKFPVAWARLMREGDSEIWLRMTPNPAEQPVRLRIMRSANICSVYLRTGGKRPYVEALKGNKATGTMCITEADGSLTYDGTLDWIKGRGNATWWMPKRPYNIKLGEKADILGTGEPHKKWCLLADSYDPTGLRNLVTLRISKELGLEETPDCRPCDLWWDGEYRGSYLITEKIGIWRGGIDTDDLEDAVEEASLANKDAAEAYENPVSVHEVPEGRMQIQYVEGVATPKRVKSGHLSGLLVENDARYEPEMSWFETSAGVFVLKSPDIASRDLVMEAQELFERAFSCLYAGGGEDEYGHAADYYFDLDSLAKIGWVYEVSGETDYLWISSSYFYVGDDGLIHAGPAWDFDLAWGNRVDYPYFLPEQRTKFYDCVLQSGNEDVRTRIAKFHPLVSYLTYDVLLGDEDVTSVFGGLRSIVWYARETEWSQRMNNAYWGRYTYLRRGDINMFRRNISERMGYVDEIVAGWNSDVTKVEDASLDELLGVLPEKGQEASPDEGEPETSEDDGGTDAGSTDEGNPSDSESESEPDAA